MSDQIFYTELKKKPWSQPQPKRPKNNKSKDSGKEKELNYVELNLHRSSQQDSKQGRLKDKEPSEEQVTYPELNKERLDLPWHGQKSKGTKGRRSAGEESVTYMDLKHHNRPQRCSPFENAHSKDSHSSLWKLISGILGILCLGLVATVTSLAFMILSNQELNNTSSSHSNTTSLNGYHSGPCPVNWVNYRNSCYLISMERKTWQDSHMICVSQNSSLLKIDSMEELVGSSFQHCLLFCPGLQVQTGDGSNGRIS
ncbi:NKG2-A/NKG2-B type II integral membrane protein-like [Ornithorhynchus anatinus]|nr:NKG2-A/NKG2-B type II integral membrane protein-like [Ornithorhynchus anatinus]